MSRVLPAWAAAVALAVLLAGWSALRFGEARATRLRLEQAMLRPMPASVRQLAPDRVMPAGGDLAAMLREDAAGGGLLVERIAPGRAPAGLAAAELVVSGEPPALLDFLNALERGRLLVRLAPWRIASDGGVARLTARALAPRPPAAFAPHAAPRFDAARSRVLLVPATFAPAVDAPDLIGIAGRLPDAAVALVRGVDGRARTLSIGETVEGWRLAALARDAALFERGGERARVALAVEEE